MKKGKTELILTLVLVLLVGGGIGLAFFIAYSFFSSSSTRDIEVITRPTDQRKISCVKPPPEDIPKDVRLKLDMAVEDVKGIAKSSAGLQFDANKIVRELPEDVHSFEIIQFRICIDYANGALTDTQYEAILQKIIPELKSAKKRLSEMSQDPTNGERIGIWIARIRGDSDEYSGQRELVQKLELYLEKETALKTLVEVRELGDEVSGIDESGRESSAKALCQKINASMLIWGEIAAILKKEEFFPRITICGDIKRVDSPIRLEPINEISRNQELQAQQPSLIRVAPQRVREPIRLAKYIVATRYYKKKDWSQAKESFEGLLREGAPETIHDRDIHFFAGFSNYYLSISQSRNEFLQKANGHFEAAYRSYETSGKDSGYPYALSALGLTQLFLYMKGAEPVDTLDRANKLFAQAAKLWLKEGNKEEYWYAQGNLAATYSVLVARGIDKEKNIEHGISILETRLAEDKERDIAGRYSGDHVNLGYLFLNKGGTATSANADLVSAEKHFLKASEDSKNRSLTSPYLSAENGLGRTYARLIRLGKGKDVRENLAKCIRAWDEVASIYQEHKLTEQYADVRMHMAESYTDSAGKEIDYAENMKSSIGMLKAAIAQYRQLQLWSKYASAQNNLVVSYTELVDHHIDPKANLLQAKLALEEGINVFRKYGPADLEKRFVETLKGVEKVLEDNQRKAGATNELLHVFS